MTKKPLILITNDDGITAPGIRHLIKLMNEIGEVIVVAPSNPQSGMGHAITMSSTLYVSKVIIDNGEQTEYSCSGTPADCVKIAKHEVLKRTPDICVSGINHGSNASINVIYSGTMSAAIEAGIEEIPAIGFSLLNTDWNADFTQSSCFIKKIVTEVLVRGLPKGIVLNVNIPNLPKEKLKGIRVCRQAKGRWIEKFDKRTNPQGKEYYWLTGEYINEDIGEDTDIYALNNGYISVVPILFDFTSKEGIDKLKTWNFNEI